ncbi:MAG: response regulator [Epsilonproteobacteria bacterium]|nr:response regulator [Campylobacterota bacterium]
MRSNDRFNILIVDDEKFNIEIVATYLKEQEYQLSYALDAQGVLKAVKQKDIDLILLDINMPGVDGFQVCSMLKSESATKDIPIIFLTAHNDIDYISRAFEVGGVDYINKPFNPVELVARVKTHLQNRAYLEDIKQKQSKLAQLSITDPLTKLHNTLFFESQIKIKLKHEKPFWVIYVKIEHFEKLNTLYGFHTSNKILKKFAQLLQDACVAKSIVARLYGVHFAMILKDYDEKTIQNIEKQIFQHYHTSEDLNNVINYSIAIRHIDKQTTLENIYKGLQNALKSVKD